MRLGECSGGRAGIVAPTRQRSAECPWRYRVGPSRFDVVEAFHHATPASICDQDICGFRRFSPDNKECLILMV
jgi:hypothetical protein